MSRSERRQKRKKRKISYYAEIDDDNRARLYNSLGADLTYVVVEYLKFAFRELGDDLDFYDENGIKVINAKISYNDEVDRLV